MFDSSVRYKTMPWEGESWTIMAYSSSAYDQLDESQIDSLRHSAFLLQDRKKEFPSSPGVPMRDMTLATMDDPAPGPAEPRTKPKVKLNAAPKVNPDPKAKPEAKPKPSSSSKGTGKSKEPDASRSPEGVADVRLSLHLLLHLLAEVIHRMIPKELKAEAKSIHHLGTHVPKNPYCEVCKRAKMYKPPSYKVGGTRTIEAKSFGDHITADHVIIRRDKDSEIEESRLALVVKGVKTAFMYAYPSALKSEEGRIASLQHFVSSADKVGNFYSDNASELQSAAKKLGWRHELSKAHIPMPWRKELLEPLLRARDRTFCRVDYRMSTGHMPLSMHAQRSTFLTLTGLSTARGRSVSVLLFLARLFLSVAESTIGLVLKGEIRTYCRARHLSGIQFPARHEMA